MLPATENPREPRFIEQESSRQLTTSSGQDQEDIYRGLMQPQASLSPKYFYDALGSRLFDAITALDAYYPTRTEAVIMSRYAADIAQAVGKGHGLIDLGAGNCQKAAAMFATLKPSHYIAVDISSEHLRQALTQLQRQHADIEMTGISMDFSTQLSMPVELSNIKGNVFYPGSSIGNFTPDEALSFLKQAHALSQGGGLILGVDMVKPKAILEAAYDDELGVTAAFNLNALSHINRLAGTDFNLRQWQHLALFNESQSRIEMHLVAKQALTVNWPGGQRHFAQGERIHTENSYKYEPADMQTLLSAAGFTSIQRFTDDAGWFSVYTALS